MVMLSNSPVVHSDREILGGTLASVGTRVPVQSLFDCLEAGETLDELGRLACALGVGRGLHRDQSGNAFTQATTASTEAHHFLSVSRVTVCSTPVASRYTASPR
jgi:Protein of unknown function (DUF433)